MAETGIKISKLPDFELPYTGEEQIPLVQRGITKAGTIESFVSYLTAPLVSEEEIAERSIPWTSTFSTVSAASADWMSTYTTMSTTSADWVSTYTTMSTTSADWASTYGSVLSLSARWDSAYIQLQAYSDFWQNTYTTVDSNSSNWEGTFNTVQANSATWGVGVRFQPTAPTVAEEGNLWFNETTGKLFAYYDDNTSEQWVDVSGGGGGGGANIVVSSTAPDPLTSSPGNLWFNNVTGVLFVFYEDINSSQWVGVGGGGGAGSASGDFCNTTVLMSDVSGCDGSINIIGSQLGIGIADPITTLHVNGTIRAQGKISIDEDTNGNKGFITQVGTDDGIGFLGSANRSVADLFVDQDGDTFINGDLKIGSSNTSNVISFKGVVNDGSPTYSHTFIGERSTGSGGKSELFLFKGNDPDFSTSGPDSVRIGAGEFRVDTLKGAVNGNFEDVATSSNLENKFIVTGVGNVGIGTETPSQKLNIKDGNIALSTSGNISGLITQSGTGGSIGLLGDASRVNADFYVNKNGASFAKNNLTAQSSLYVDGQFRYRNGTAEVGQVLTCTNTNGTAQWQDNIIPGLVESIITQPITQLGTNFYAAGTVIGGTITGVWSGTNALGKKKTAVELQVRVVGVSSNQLIFTLEESVSPDADFSVVKTFTPTYTIPADGYYQLDYVGIGEFVETSNNSTATLP